MCVFKSERESVCVCMNVCMIRKKERDGVGGVALTNDMKKTLIVKSSYLRTASINSKQCQT